MFKGKAALAKNPNIGNNNNQERRLPNE
jgi:hypothetical protein